MERVNEYRTSLTRNLRFLLFLTRKALGRRSCLTKHFLGLGPRDVQGCFRFRYRIVWNVFGHLWTSTEVLGKRQICLCRLRKSWYSPVKNLTPLTQKKLAGILTGRWSLTRSQPILGQNFASFYMSVKKVNFETDTVLINKYRHRRQKRLSAPQVGLSESQNYRDMTSLFSPKGSFFKTFSVHAKKSAFLVPNSNITTAFSRFVLAWHGRHLS